ncbi:hypothetical protein [Sinomicrobium sp. M5D2P9]
MQNREGSKNYTKLYYDSIAKPLYDRSLLAEYPLGYALEPPTKYKKQWYDILEPEGVKRYQWLYEAGDIPLDPEQRKKSMLPDYMGVLPEVQGQGYGSLLSKWTLNHFEERGFDIPFLLASTRRSSKLYAPILGFQVHKEVYAQESDVIPAGVFMKRNRSLLRDF